jgi:hypothetical protein
MSEGQRRLGLHNNYVHRTLRKVRKDSLGEFYEPNGEMLSVLRRDPLPTLGYGRQVILGKGKLKCMLLSTVQV